jgi:aspartate beta-hydroxylase
MGLYYAPHFRNRTENPVSTDALQLFHQGRLAEAEALVHKKLEARPEDPEALVVLGMIGLRTNKLNEAQQALERATRVSPRHALARHYLARVYDAQGNLEAALKMHQAAVALEPTQHVTRLHYGVALERSGLRDAAAIQYSRALGDAQSQGRWENPGTTPPLLRPLVENAVLTVRAFRWQAFDKLLAPLREKFGASELARVERALRIYLREEVPQYLDERQRPTFFYFPELPPFPYFDRKLFPWIPRFEAETSTIREELMNLLPSVSKSERVFGSVELEKQNLRGTEPSWNGYYFYRHGVRREDNCSACPRTAAALDSVPLSRVREHGPEVLFSVFTAGTHLLPHRGVTNTRIVAHLPLIVPKDCALSVAGLVHEWKEGEIVVFDDTYEHEAWNRSQNIRVVLIFDLWNPFLTEVERIAVAELIAAMGDYRVAVEAA